MTCRRVGFLGVGAHLKSALAVSVTVLASSGCSSTTSGDSCTPGDQDGVIGQTQTVLVSVSDATFAVGGVDSGSLERNIAVQNRSQITLTVTNVGTRPHDLVIGCIPTGLPAGCPATSCLPSSANIPVLQPGTSATTTFMTPTVEGAYKFTSDAPGDADGGLEGLIGEFVLM